MALDFFIIDHAGDGEFRYSLGDVADIQPARGDLNPAGPFRRLRIQTTRTKDEVMSYLAPKTTGQAKRRERYLDTTKMDAASRNTWDLVRCIETTEATALGWLSKK